VEYTEFQKKGFEIAKTYANLPLQDRLDIIAQTFGCKTARVETHPCTGKWRGTSDMSVVLDNGSSLFIGNRRTPEAKKAATISEYVNNTLGVYNPETVAEAKQKAIIQLMEREATDNAVATERGLKPYKILNVELNDGSYHESGGYLGWYYVTVEVEDKIFGLLETGLCHDIARNEFENRTNYYVAGALKDDEVDFVFNNVGHSSASSLYKMDLSADVLQRARETLERRNNAEREAMRTADERIEKSEYEQAIKTAENNILNRQTVLNTDLPDGKSIIMQLFREHDIAVPQETQGWIINDLTDIHYSGKDWEYTYFIKSNDCAEFSNYLPMLVSAVQTKQQYEEMKRGEDSPDYNGSIENEDENEDDIGI
jgi:hypothetical protein